MNSVYVTPPTWWESNKGKFIRDAYCALIPPIVALVWNYVMTVQIPVKDAPFWLPVAIVLARSLDRQVRKWLENQRAKSL